MILKGSTISSTSHARGMAAHLFKDENEAVLIREGLSKEQSRRSFENDLVKLQQLVNLTKGKIGVFHVAVNAREGEEMTPEQHEKALQRVEKEFGLSGQLRMQIDHIKDGKLHTHVFWSRVNLEENKLIPLSHYGRRLKSLAAEVAKDNGHEPVPQDWSDTTFSVSHADRAIAKRQGRKVLDIKKDVTAIWTHSETGAEFVRNLRAFGFDIAKGDKRALVLIDQSGKAVSLPRQLPKGINLKQVREKLGELEQGLKGVEETKTLWAARQENNLEQEIKDKAVTPKKDQDGKAKMLYEGLSIEEATKRGLDHFLERQSSVSEERLTFHVSQNTGESQKAIREALKQNKEAIKALKDGQTFITTHKAVQEEEKLVQQAKAGQGRHKPLNPDYEPKQEFLNEGQKGAIGHILNSKDQVILLSGAAGVGKTSLMKEVKDGIEEQGQELHAFAPSAQASRGVLQDKGFEGADTIAGFLKSKEKQDKTRGQVILIDEAGMIGNKTMNRILGIAKEQNARVILSGDHRQHNSPEAGDALRIIEQRSGLKVARVDQIVRQKNEPYKQAVDELAQGNTREGFKKLEAIGAVREETDDRARNEEAAKAYINSLERGRTALVVSPTHAEGQEVSSVIRSELKERGIIDKQDRSFETQSSLSMTQDQMKSAASYGRGMSIQFHGQAEGFELGKSYNVTGRAKDGRVIVRDQEGEYKTLPLDQSERFQVFQNTKTKIAKGDLIRITGNGQKMEGEAINNGQTDTVAGFDQNGNIELVSGGTLDKSYKNFALGYYATSHASQGQDAQDVYICQSSKSFAASSQKQFYVSVSRGTENVTVFTDDKKELEEAILKSGDRMTAAEVAEKSPTFVFNRNVKEAPSQPVNLREKFTKEKGAALPERADPAFDEEAIGDSEWFIARLNEGEDNDLDYEDDRPRKPKDKGLDFEL